MQNPAYFTQLHKPGTKKRFLLSGLFLLFSVIVFSQSFDLSSHWTEITTSVFDETMEEINDFKLQGDTVLNEQTYRKLYRNGIFLMGLRNSDDNKVYVCLGKDEQEYLLYDFDWSVGKVLQGQMYGEDGYFTSATIEEINSIQLLDGNTYDCIRDHEDEVFLIQGIGDLKGFLFGFSGVTYCGCFTETLCFYKGSKLVYSNPKYNYCGTTALKQVKCNKPLRIYPIPSRGSVTLELPQDEITDWVNVYGANGVLVQSQKVKNQGNIQIEQLQPGLYICQVLFKSGKVKVSEFVVLD